MAIKIKLLFSIVVAVIVVAITGFYVYQATQQISREIGKAEVAQKIVQVATTRRGLILDFYRFHEERPKAQWQLLLDAQTKLTSSDLFDTPDERSDLRQINETSEEVISIFTELVANYEKPKPGPAELMLAEEFEQVLLSQLLSQIQTNITRAYSLSDNSLTNLKTAQSALVAVATASVATLFLFFAALFFSFNQFIAKPLIKLKEDFLRIASLDFYTTTTTTTTGSNSNDEIGGLSRAFNTMTAKLKESYTILEQKVRDRTRDLEKFKLAVENTSEMVVITDPEGVVLYGNKAVEEITGYKPVEAIGKKSGTLWKTPMPAEYYQKMWDTIKIQKKSFVGEIQNKRKNGQIYTAVISISPILSEKGEVEFFVGIERDITKEKEIDKAKTEFVSLASHQLRTPLTGIEWTIELFSKKEKLTEEGKKYLQDIHFSAKRLNMLIKLLLNTSRIESGSVGVSPEPLELVGFINQYAREYQLLCARTKSSLVFTKHPKKLEATTDKNLLGFIIQNIVANAIDYTLAGGKIEIILEGKKDTAFLQVRDTGIGIPKKESARIFEKFSRASNAVFIKPDGTGLGLYIVQESVKLLGGKIWFESKEGKGSTFYVEFPLQSPAKGGAKQLVGHSSE